MYKITRFVVLCVIVYISSLYAEDKCIEWKIELPRGIRIERAFFDSHISNNLFIIGEGGNGIFLYDIHKQTVKQIYYSRVVTESVNQVSIKNLSFEPFYKRGFIKEIDVYYPSKMPKNSKKVDICNVKNGRLYCTIDGKEREIAPFLGEPEVYSFSEDMLLLLFANKLAGGYVYGTKTQEIAKLGFGTDFKFVNKYDVIFVNNSKINNQCSNSYIYYWHNQAIDTFLIYSDRDGCIRYPDANKDTLIYIKDHKIFKCPLNLLDAVLRK